MGENATPQAAAGKSAAEATVGSSAALAIALIVGILGACFIAFFWHWYYVVIFAEPSMSWQVIATTLPPIVFFMLLLVLVIANPLLALVHSSLILRRRELFLMLSMWLLGSAICWESLGTPVIHAAGETMYNATTLDWPQRVKFKDYLPRPSILLPGPPERVESRDFHYGLSEKGEYIPVSQVPWGAWVRPLSFWVPLMLVAIVFSSTLVQMVHRQWSKHELLCYPIAEYADSMIGMPPDRVLPRVFYDKVFWIGFGVTAFIFLLFGLNAYFPLMVKIPLKYSHVELLREFSFLNRYCGREAYSLLRGPIYPYVIALAVLLPTEISLTSWLGYVLMILGTGVYFLFTGVTIGNTETVYAQCGMYVSMLAMIIIIGRREYASILRHAFTFRRSEDPALNQAAIACWIFAASFVALWGLAAYAGMHWLPALVLVLAFGLVVVILARFTAEVGFPWLVSVNGMARFFPLNMLGAAAIGPKSLAVMAIISAALDVNTVNTVAAQETTYRRLEERQTTGVTRWRVNLMLLITACFVIGATVFTNLWNDYSFGAKNEVNTTNNLNIPLSDESSREIDRLKAEGKLELTNGATWREKLGMIQSKQDFWRFFTYGVIVIAACMFMRLRFTWWPFHPLPLLFVNTWALSRMYVSFALGWAIKVAILRIGGGKVFMRSKPFFMGAILGQIAMGGVWLIVGSIYYYYMQVKPPVATFWIDAPQ